MISGLPTPEAPSWLTDLTQRTALEQPLPLQNILRDSLYYPSSRFDGDPIRHLGGNFHSFVYVDYGVTEDELNHQVADSGFMGYRKLFTRKVEKKELIPNGWLPRRPDISDGDPMRARISSSSGFCKWHVFEREESFGKAHGPCRFSLLYLCADGVAAYQALYVGNKLSSNAIAVIQPGHAFGGNWTDFTDYEGILARTVIDNPSGRPNVLLYGGYGSRNSYSNPCWPCYQHNVGYLSKRNEGLLGNIGVWVIDHDSDAIK